MRIYYFGKLITDTNEHKEKQTVHAEQKNESSTGLTVTEKVDEQPKTFFVIRDFSHA